MTEKSTGIKTRVKSSPVVFSVRGDAFKSIAVTLVIHVFLIIVLGAILIDRAARRPIELVVRDADDQVQIVEDAEPDSQVYASRIVAGAGIQSVELSYTQIPLGGMALDMVSPISGDHLWDSILFEISETEDSSESGIPENGKRFVQGWTGIQISMDKLLRLPKIASVVVGGPAHREGVLGVVNHGDYIISVDGHATANRALEEVRDLIVGQSGSVVNLGICKYPGSLVEIVSIRRGR